LSEFSGDEAFTSVICWVTALPCILSWYAATSGGRILGPRPARGRLLLTPLVCLALLLAVLLRFGSHELRENRGYVFLFVLGGCLGLGLVQFIAATMGISLPHDAIDRANRPAATTLCGALLGATLCYAGADIGEGATIWTTFVPALLAIAAWASVWAGYQLLTNVADAVAIDRDSAAAWRLAGLLVASGLILGRSVAGDYESASRTLRDFVFEGWPAAALLIVAAGIDGRIRSTLPSSPAKLSIWPATAYVLAAVAYVVRLGPWNHLPRGGGQ
jgi:hypothetical protein